MNLQSWQTRQMSFVLFTGLALIAMLYYPPVHDAVSSWISWVASHSADH